MEKDFIKLSIIIPVYNTPVKYLQECLDSITKAKINCKYEVLIINDGSTDTEVISFLKKYSEESTTILHKQNTGVSATRNLGLDKAQGQFVLFLDSDDVLLPSVNHYIEVLMCNNQYHVVYGDWCYFGDEKYVYKPGNFSKFKHIYIGTQVHTCSLLRRDFLEKNKIRFNEKFSTSEDWDFWCRVAVLGGGFRYEQKPLFRWRKIRDGKSLSQQKNNFSHREEVLKLGKSQYDAHKEITLREVNLYVLNNFRDNKKHVFKLLIILFFPWLFKVLKKKGIYKNDIVID
ncbi:glycosyltransferase [Riemerella anatipestifer]|uniref:glycosyltransferase family 2 protein n=1 Tax=Riemerella anatipestifer TaxID=34085 RepID=UPI000699E7EF|nr:glycosyltransferase [Riemerella anatipestifer]MDY3351472.1 glycosyltransferase [Riemerella anatipestifer]